MASISSPALDFLIYYRILEDGLARLMQSPCSHRFQLLPKWRSESRGDAIRFCRSRNVHIQMWCLCHLSFRLEISESSGLPPTVANAFGSEFCHEY
jgi:hypothetical protein